MGSTAAEPAATDQIAPKRLFWILSGLTVLALLLRLPMLGRPIWFDEACMADERIGTTGQWLATLYTDIHPPLFVTFMHFWNNWFGDGELSMRLPALLAGLLCLPLTWWTGHRFVGHRAALLAVALLALSPVHIWYSAEARLYTPLVVCSLLAFGCFDRLIEDNGKKRAWLFLLHTLNVAVMLSLHYYLAVIVAGLSGLAPIIARGMPARAFRIVLMHGIGIMLLAGYVFLKSQMEGFETSQSYLRSLTLSELYQFLFNWCFTGNSIAPDSHSPQPQPVADIFAVASQVLAVVLVTLGVKQLIRQRQQFRSNYLLPIALLILPCFLFACALIGYGNTYLERTLLPSLPFVLLLIGSGLASLRGRVQHAVVDVTFAFMIGSLVCLHVYRDTHWTVYKPNPDYRSAAAWLGKQIDGFEGRRPIYSSTPNPRPLSYYDVRIQDWKNLQPPASVASIGEKVASRLGSGIGDLARQTFQEYAAHHAMLLENARLWVYQSPPTPRQLTWPEGAADRVAYLVRDHWHPHVTADNTIESLLAHQDVKVREERHFVGVSVYKVHISP